MVHGGSGGYGLGFMSHDLACGEDEFECMACVLDCSSA